MYILIIPWLFRKNFIGMAIYPFILLKHKTYQTDSYLINHEKIHLAQQRELLLLVFYIFYSLEYICRIFQYRFNTDMAYRNISFEREAYQNQFNLNYLNKRKLFSFIKYY